MTHPSDQIPVADDFYLIALDDRTWKLRLHSRALGLGLSAALLTELILGNHLVVESDRLRLLARRPAADDAVHAKMLDHIEAEPQHTVNVWLSFFAQTASESVAHRLVSAGALQVETSRGLLRSKAVYTPVDVANVAWRPLRILQAISRRDVQTWEDLALIGLLRATGLIEAVTAHAARDVQGDIREILAGLSDEASLHTLISQVEALIAANVLRTT